MRSVNGFTLIETLLALAIFSLIAVATVRHIQQLQNTKTEAFQQIDMYDGVRAAISMIRSDLSQAFHIPYDDLGEEAKAAVMQNQPAAHTLFDGRKSDLIFTSASHRLYYQGLHESEQTEISYFLQPRAGNKYPSLMKRESEFIDNDLYQGGKIYTVLDNVISLQYSFWDEKAGKWIDDWNSDNGEYRDRFPLAIKMKLSVQGAVPTDQITLQQEFKLAFPNNEGFLVQF